MRQLETDSLTFIGTATALLRLGPFTVLTDPDFLHRGRWSYFGQGLFSRRRTEPAMRPAELPPLNAVVVSHLHGDHFDRTARRELPHDVPIVTTGHAAAKLGKSGFTEPVPLETWARQDFIESGATLSITAVPARHTAGPLNRLLPPVMGSVLEYHPAGGGAPKRLYLSGDTVMHGGLATIRQRFGQLDVAVLHLGGTQVLGVLLSMDHEQGVDLLELLRPERVVPVHHDDYGLFRSPLSNFEAELDRRRPPTELHRLRRGESLAL